MMMRTPILVASTDGRVIERFRSYLKSADEVLLASAYVSSGALETLLPDFERIVGRGGSVQLYAAFDGGAFTRPETFQRLIDLKRRAPVSVGVYLNPRQGSIFHAKVFLFRNRRGWRGIVGSANLTTRGLQGANFEVCTDWPEMSTKDVEAVRTELSLLRTSGQLTELTAERIDEVIGLHDAKRLSPEERAARDRMNKRARDSLLKRIDAMKPGQLPPLPPLAETAREWTQGLANSGCGIAVTTELEELSISLQFDPFVRANIVAKETSRQIGLVKESTRKGYSLSLVPEGLRQTCSTAARSVGRLIAVRSVDLSYSRWIPERFVTPLEEEIAEKRAIVDAEDALRRHDVIDQHLEKVGKEFESTVEDTVGRLQLRPADEWNLDAGVFSRFHLSRRSSESEVRSAIAEYLRTAHGSKISKPFVSSQLRRVSFTPRTFTMPLEQRMGEDFDYGHKAFLAAIVWAFTDRVLKFDDEDVRSTGELFEYLHARHQLNAPRREKHGEQRRLLRDLASTLADESAEWLEPSTPLDEAVEGMRTAFGPTPWTWETADL
jgi:HKD family nuclease